jgi:hypothetical protein
MSNKIGYKIKCTLTDSSLYKLSVLLYACDNQCKIFTDNSSLNHTVDALTEFHLRMTVKFT